MRNFWFSFITLFIVSLAYGQEVWHLEKEKHGIKVFTRKSTKSNIKDSKTELTVKGTPDEVIKEFRNVANHKLWMHRIATSELHKKINENEFYAYYVAKAPWPVSDRDVVAHYSIKKESNGNYIINCVGKPQEIPIKSGKVRVPKLSASWEIVSLKNGTSKIIYITSSEAGGSIPDWLANSSATDTPFETVAALKAIVEK